MTTAELHEQFEIVENTATVRTMYSGRITGTPKRKKVWTLVERETGIPMYQLSSRKEVDAILANPDWFAKFLASPEATRIRKRYAERNAK